MILVQSGRFRQRFEGIEKLVAPFGDVEAGDSGAAGAVRTVAFRVDAPGHGLPRQAVFEYKERYRRVREGWFRASYWYEYRPLTPSRRAQHDHVPQGVHQHCCEAGPPERHLHYVDRPRLLEETHEAFVRIYAAIEEIRCAGLIPFRLKRGARARRKPHRRDAA